MFTFAKIPLSPKCPAWSLLCAALWPGQLTTAEVYVNAERVLPCRDSARNPKSQQNGKDDLVAQRLH